MNAAGKSADFPVVFAGSGLEAQLMGLTVPRRWVNGAPHKAIWNPNLLVDGLQVTAAPVHAKIRRDGHRR